MADDRTERQSELPRMDFSVFILSLHHSARVHLGDAPITDDGECKVDLSLARQTIDLIEILMEKTKGNLTGEEERLIGHVLYELRMRYVEVSKKWVS